MQPTTPPLSAIHADRVARRRDPSLTAVPAQASLPLLPLLRGALLSMIADDGHDLSARQLAVLLTVKLDPEPQTVRGLATRLKVSKPAITRAIDRLTTEGLARRRPDPADRRSIFVDLTRSGAAFLAKIHAASEVAE